MKKVIYIFIALSCIIYPFYLIDSGYPQISDMFLGLAFLLFIFNYRFRRDKILLTVLILILLISIINLLWGFIYSSPVFLLSIFYYFFNFMILIMGLNLYFYHGKELLHLLYKAVFFSIFLQVITSPLLINTGLTRQSLMFNNPNQLGYYSLLSLCILTLLFYMLKKNVWQYYIIVVCTLYLALLSNSSSAILSIGFVLGIQLILIYIYRLNIKQKILFIVATLCIVFFTFNFWSDITNYELIDNMLNRFAKKESTADNILYERRYDRVLDNLHLTIFGAGEGLSVQRFGKGEIHSTLVAFFFSYGVLSSALLILLFLFLIRKPTLISLIVLFSVHFYGFTHNGIRQPIFWLLHVIVYIGNTDGSLSINKIKNYVKKKDGKVESSTVPQQIVNESN